MISEHKFSVGEIVNYRMISSDKPERFLIVLVCFDERGVFYCNGRNTQKNLYAREEQLSHE